MGLLSKLPRSVKGPLPSLLRSVNPLIASSLGSEGSAINTTSSGCFHREDTGVEATLRHPCEFARPFWGRAFVSSGSQVEIAQRRARPGFRRRVCDRVAEEYGDRAGPLDDRVDVQLSSAFSLLARTVDLADRVL